MSIRSKVIATLSLPLVLSGCSSPLLKAPPVALSGFVAASPKLADSRKSSPFQQSGGSLISSRSGIYIAPVSTAFLRTASKSLTKGGDTAGEREQASKALADYARRQFVDAFANSKAPRYQLRNEPSKDCITVQIALTELNHNTLAGAVSRFAIGFATVPGAEVALGKLTRGLKGNIAIEGKVTDAATGKVIYQFADNEESRANLLLPITDLQRYGQARQAIRTWATQFEKLTRASLGERVKDNGAFGLF